MSDNLPAVATDTKPGVNRRQVLVALLLNDTGSTPVKTLAVQAGYKPGTVHNIHTKVINTDSFQRLLIAAFKQSNSLQLPKVLQIRNKVLQKALAEKGYLEANSSLVTKMTERAERVAGVVQDDIKAPQTINIKELTIAQHVLQQHFDTQDDS